MLETEIKKLTSAIERLCELIEKTEVPAPAPEPTVEIETPPVTVVNPCTRDELQSLCLETVRANRDLKIKIKTIIEDAGATNISSLPDDMIDNVYAAIVALGE